MDMTLRISSSPTHAMATIAATNDADITHVTHVTHKIVSATDNMREQVVQALCGGGDRDAVSTSATKDARPRPSLMAFMLRG